jgi:hypothetical protein
MYLETEGVFNPLPAAAFEKLPSSAVLQKRRAQVK